MKKTILVSLLAGLGLAFTQAPVFAAASAFAGNLQYVPDQVLVKFKPGVAATLRAQMAQSYGAQTMQSLGSKSEVVLAKLATGRTVEQAVAAYKNDPNVAYVQPDYIYHIQSVPNDPKYDQLWAAKNAGQSIITGSYPQVTRTAGNDMNLESAWSVKTDCRSVVVAVVDSGVNYNSEDLSANMWAGNAKHGQNFASDAAIGVNSDPMDLNGHGTHVAGIIGAVGNNAKGGVGVCWQASIMAVRVMDALGSGSTSTIIQGINYAVTNGAKVINMSLGGTGGFDPLYSDAITNAQNNNVLVVVAAGNDNQNNETTAHWPCNFTHANLICVAALDQNYALATFSDYGSTSVDVGAPGTNIYSTWAGTSGVMTDNLTGGWTPSTTTSGGWTYGTLSVGGVNTPFLVNPANYNTGQYSNSTNDKMYKEFNLSGVNVAVVDFYAVINVMTGDYFNVNYASAGGDPFLAGGVPVATGTNLATYPNFLHVTRNISDCIGANCSLGFQLTSDASLTDKGLAIGYFTIKTLIFNNTSYNTIDGTSMATPEVAGVAALVWANNPLYTYADVANAIKNGGRTTTSLSGKTTTGKAVDAMGSLSYINPPAGIAVVVH